jgi:tRNA-2-methylthio-N6-dimethylallyladenosine synthase
MSHYLYFFETYGCQMNKAESAGLGRQLDSAGWKPASQPEGADLVVLNTCSVRQTAEDRIVGRLGFYRHLKSTRDFKLAVIGCMSQRLQNRLLEDHAEVDLVMGSYQKHRFLQAAETILSTHQRLLLTETADFQFEKNYSLRGQFKVFVPIMHGCNNFCTYCIVPYVRGPEVSRSPASVLEEIKLLDAREVKEVTLLGQNVNSYHYGSGGEAVDFTELLRRIAKEVKNIEWLRFLTSHPKDLSRDLILLLRDEPLLCQHVHLPVQHGSDTILESMGRGYTSAQYLDLVGELKNAISDVSITTDILIGFPGETEEDFNQTIELMKTVRFDDAFTYRYNPRQGRG